MPTENERMPLMQTSECDDDSSDYRNIKRNESSDSCLNVRSLPIIIVLAILLIIFFAIALVAVSFLFYTLFIEDQEVCSTMDCVRVAGTMLEKMNMSSKPCDDFYEFACGRFKINENIANGETKWNNFAKFRTAIRKEMRQVLEASSPPNDAPSYRKKVYRFYKSCLDVDAIDKNGIGRLNDIIVELGGLLVSDDDTVPNDWTLMKLLKARNRYSYGGLFAFSVGQDQVNTSMNVLKIDQGSLGLGPNTRDYYIDKNVRSDRVLSAYADKLQTFAEILFKDSGKSVNRDVIEDVVRFEQVLAEAQLAQSEHSPVSMYKKVDVAWLQDNIGFINWLEFFNDALKLAGVKIRSDEPVVMLALPFFEKLTETLDMDRLQENKKRTLQNYIVFKIISKYGPDFGSSFKKADEDFQKVLVGQGLEERWSHCIESADERLDTLLSEVYIQNLFPQSAKNKTLFVIGEIISSFDTKLQNAAWMDEETRSKGREKLAAVTYDAAYPDWLLNVTFMENRYSSLDITDDYTQNILTSNIFYYKQRFKKLREHPNSDDWSYTPITSNAYFSIQKNALFILAGALREPVFYAEKDIPDSMIFGGLGTVIGHELTHGFDNKGSYFDMMGNMKQWWKNETLQKFKDLSQCFVDQYSAYEVNGMHLRGEQTIGENIADNGGFRTAYQAFKTATSKGITRPTKRLVGVDFTNEQLFFISFAQVWCGIFTEEKMKLQILQNEHAPGLLRVLGVTSNSVEFANAFNCPSTSRQNPAKKCLLW